MYRKVSNQQSLICDPKPALFTHAVQSTALVAPHAMNTADYYFACDTRDKPGAAIAVVNIHATGSDGF